MRKQIAALVIAGSAVVGISGAPSAQAAETATTFALTAGSLSVTTPANSTISSAATGAAVTSSALGTVTVTDARGALAGTWTATAASTDFVTGGGTASEKIVKANVSYLAPAPTIVAGTVVPVSAGAKVLSASQTVVTAASIIGNNTVSWSPTVTITLPSAAVAGTYTGTITHSIA